MSEITITQRYLGYRPYILVEYDEDTEDMVIEAGGGTREEMVAMSKKLAATGRAIRKSYKNRDKENNND